MSELRTVKGHSNYAVNDEGMVWSFQKNKFLSPRWNNTGYAQVVLDGQQFLVHRIVAEAFIENPNNLPIINHKDENPRNNCANNLEWCTHKYNVNYGTRAEARKKQVMCIETGKVYPSQADAAQDFGVPTY